MKYKVGQKVKFDGVMLRNMTWNSHPAIRDIDKTGVVVIVGNNYLYVYYSKSAWHGEVSESGIKYTWCGRAELWKLAAEEQLLFDFMYDN